MVSIVFGDSDPLSKVCLAITPVKQKCHVYEVAIRLLNSIFERTIGPFNAITLLATSEYSTLMAKNANFAVAESLQRMVVSDLEKLKHKSCQDILYYAFFLGLVLSRKGDHDGAKKAFRDALQLSRAPSGDRFPTQFDLHVIKWVVFTLSEDEYVEGEVLLEEALQKCLQREHWGRYDWHTVHVLELLMNLLEKQEKFDEAGILRLKYPETFD
jgi:tetratricopeptide (TPR) repeat protein